MASLEVDSTKHESNFGERLLERMEGLLRRGIASELSGNEVAAQVLSLIQEWVTFKAQNPDEHGPQFENDAPGVESMGWELWDAVDLLARDDERHHDALIAFINAFFPLLRTQPWQLWGKRMPSSDFLLGASFRESVNQFEKNRSDPPVVEFTEEQRLRKWANFCRFVARMTRDTEHDFSLFLLWFARDALEDCSWCPPTHVNAPVVAWEGVVDVCGAHMFRSEEEYGREAQGGDGKRRWAGKPGFCEQRWLFWEAGLLDIARDEARPIEVRESAQRTATKMKSIREEEVSDSLPSRDPGRTASAKNVPSYVLYN